MSKKPDAEVIAFMQTILRALDMKNAGELKTKLVRDGYMTSDQSRKVNRWVSGENSPRFHEVMYLLRISGLLPLTQDAGRAAELRETAKVARRAEPRSSRATREGS